jgi:DNA-binding NarL/FixJ family response regulator
MAIHGRSCCPRDSEAADSNTGHAHRDDRVDFLPPDAWLDISRSLQLSEREAQVVGLILRDESESGIATQLGISSHTVHTHLERLYRKLSVTSRCQVVIRIFRAYIARDASHGGAAVAVAHKQSNTRRA